MGAFLPLRANTTAGAEVRKVVVLYAALEPPLFHGSASIRVVGQDLIFLIYLPCRSYEGFEI